MLNHIIRIRLVVLASLSVFTVGVVVSTGDNNSSAASSHTSVTAHQQLTNSGVFGWD